MESFFPYRGIRWNHSFHTGGSVGIILSIQGEPSESFSHYSGIRWNHFSHSGRISRNNFSHSGGTVGIIFPITGQDSLKTVQWLKSVLKMSLELEDTYNRVYNGFQINFLSEKIFLIKCKLFLTIIQINCKSLFTQPQINSPPLETTLKEN